jgi:hypothetical protein
MLKTEFVKNVKASHKLKGRVGQSIALIIITEKTLNLNGFKKSDKAM